MWYQCGFLWFPNRKLAWSVSLWVLVISGDHHMASGVGRHGNCPKIGTWQAASWWRHDVWRGDWRLLNETNWASKFWGKPMCLLVSFFNDSMIDWPMNDSYRRLELETLELVSLNVKPKLLTISGMTWNDQKKWGKNGPRLDSLLLLDEPDCCSLLFWGVWPLFDLVLVMGVVACGLHFFPFPAQINYI